MKFSRHFALLLAFSLVGGTLVGCGGGSNTAESEPSPSPAETTQAEAPEPETPETTASAAADTEYEPVEFTLVNDTDRPLLEFYVSAPDEKVWGEDLIPADAYIGPRKQIPVKINDGRPDCAYDLKAVFGPSPDGSVGAGEVFQTKVEICDGTTYTYSQGG